MLRWSHKQSRPRLDLFLARLAQQFHCVAEAFSGQVATEMRDGVEEGDALGLAGDRDVEGADDVFEFRFEDFGGAA